MSSLDTSIIGAGENATILHYIENNCAIADGDLVLVDAGAEYNGYTADITRTWPANGKFSEVQRRVYQIVLDCQVEAVEMVKPGVTLDQIHELCVRRLTEGMIALGCLRGIEATGDGTRQQPFVVTYPADEYDLMMSRDKEAQSQMMVDEGGKVCDVMQFEDGSEMWFDISRPYTVLQRRKET